MEKQKDGESARHGASKPGFKTEKAFQPVMNGDGQC
jgi:hypothetical protein